jgi:hypothetical protein
MGGKQFLHLTTEENIMKANLGRISVAVAIAAAFGSAGFAVAQGTAGPGCGMAPDSAQGCPAGQGPGQGRMGMGMGPGHGAGSGHGMMGSDAASRLDAVKAALNLAPNQDAAWQKYADTMKTQVEARDKLRDGMRATMQSGDTTAEQRNAWREAMHAFNTQAATDRAKAREALYAALTPEQRTVADRYLAAPQVAGRGDGEHRH